MDCNQCIYKHDPLNAPCLECSKLKTQVRSLVCKAIAARDALILKLFGSFEKYNDYKKKHPEFNLFDKEVIKTSERTIDYREYSVYHFGFSTWKD